MKRLLGALGLIAGLCLPLLAAPSGPPAGNYIQNVSTNVSVQIFSVSSGTVANNFYIPYLQVGQCATVNSSGQVIGIACGSGAANVAFTTGTATGFTTVTSSPTKVVVFDSSTFNGYLEGAASFYVLPNPSSVTLQGNNLSATYLTNSSATATYLTLSSATATYLTNSSAAVTYFNLANILSVAHGGTGTSSPGLIAGTNMGTFTGTWPNITINASNTLATVSGSPSTGNCAQWSSINGISDAGAPCGTGGTGGGGDSIYPATATASFPFGASFSTVTTTGNACIGKAISADGTFITDNNGHLDASTLINPLPAISGNLLYALNPQSLYGQFSPIELSTPIAATWVNGQTVWMQPDVNSIYLGYQAGENAYNGLNLYNVGIGNGVMFTGPSGLYNTCGGYTACYADTTGTGNAAWGYASLNATTSGSYNTMIGMSAGQLNITGSDNTCIGAFCLFTSTSSTNNIGIGTGVLEFANYAGNYNVGIGNNALNADTSGSVNTAIGYSSLSGNTSGTSNDAQGYNSMASNTTGASNTCQGDNCLSSNVTGSNNTCQGADCLLALNGGHENNCQGEFCLLNDIDSYYNVASGYQSLYSVTHGVGNVAIGVGTGYNAFGAIPITTGSYNTLLGHNTGWGGSSGQPFNATALGANAIVSASSTTQIGGAVGSGYETNTIVSTLTVKGADNTGCMYLDSGYLVHGTGLACGSGGGGASGTIVAAVTGDLPYYSLAGSSNIISGRNNFSVWPSSFVTTGGAIVVVSSNTILPGATFYQNAPSQFTNIVDNGVPDQDVLFSSNSNVVGTSSFTYNYGLQQMTLTNNETFSFNNPFALQLQNTVGNRVCMNLIGVSGVGGDSGAICGDTNKLDIGFFSYPFSFLSFLSFTPGSSYPTYSTTTITGNMIVTSLSGNGTKCLHSDNTGLVSDAGADCGSGGGGASSLAVTTGAVGGYTYNISSPTAVIIFDSSTFNGQLLAANTYFATLNTSSVTLQGNGIIGSTHLPADVVYTDVNQTMTAIKTAVSSWTFTNGLGSTGVVTLGGASNSVTISSNAILPGATFYQSGSILIGNAGAYILHSTNTIMPGATFYQNALSEISNIKMVSTGADFLTMSTATTAALPLVRFSSSPAVNPSDFILNVASPSVGTPLFQVNLAGHVISSGTIPSVSSCGTSPTMDSNSTDFAGTINVGSASPTACTLTFANAFLNTPVCVVSDDLQTSEPAITTRANTGFTLTLGAALNSGHIFYICVGSKG